MLSLVSRLRKLAVSPVRYSALELSTQPETVSKLKEPQDLNSLIEKRNAQLIESMRSKGLPEFLTPHQTWVHSIKDSTKLDRIMLLDPVVFNFKPRIDILNDVIRWHQACQRHGLVAQKNRAEKRGGGRKPWPQKGTGRARQGSIRAPHFKGGGKAHAKKPTDFSYNLPLSLQHLGLCTLLTLRLLQGDMVVVDRLMPAASSQDKTDVPEDFIVNLLKRYKCKSIYFADDFKDPKFEHILQQCREKSGEKVPRLEYYASSDDHCAYDMICCHKLIITVAGLRLYEKKIAKSLRKIDYELE